MLPSNLAEAVAAFADEGEARRAVAAARWPNGPVCPRCGADKVGEIASRSLLQCGQCRRQFSVRTGTVMEDSPLPVGHWLTATWAALAGGVSSPALASALGTTTKTAWRMLRRLRPTVAKEPDKTDDLARKLVCVPKKEIAREERKWKRRRRPKKK